MTMLAAASTRDHRMLTTLLAACDPCGYVDGGDSPLRYNAAAGKVLHLFRRRRYSTTDIVLELPGEADAARAVQFAHVASAWWTAQQDAVWRNRGGLTARM